MSALHQGLRVAAMAMCAASTPLAAQPVMSAAPSTRATAEVTFNVAAGMAQPGAAPLVLRVDYGQPHLRGRQLHTDSLVPYGQVWRTGANAATTLRTDVDIEIGGARIPKGNYSIVTLPTRESWTLIIQRADAPGASEYSTAYDVARVPLRRTTLASPVESFSMWLIPGVRENATRGELRMAWSTVGLSVDWRLP